MSPNLMPRKVKGASLDRRTFIAGAGALMLAGCTDAAASIRYRVVCKLLVDGDTVEGSTVMELKYSRLKNSALGYGGATSLKGEAMIIDVPGRPSLFAIPFWRPPRGALMQYYEYEVLRAVGISNSVGSLSDDDLQRIAQATGECRFPKGTPLPVFLSFTDETNPMTAFQVDPSKGQPSGVWLKDFYIEVTRDSVTQVLRKRLPWLDSKEDVFPRDPPGKVRPYSESTVPYMVTQTHFFGLR